MAVVRARTAPPYPLFVAIFLCVVFAGAAGLMYYMWDQSTTESTAAKNALARMADDADQRAARANGSSSMTAYKQQQAQIDQLKALIAGSGNAESVEDMKNDAVLRPALDKHLSLKAAVKAMSDDLAEKEAALARANARAETALAASGGAQKQMTDLTAGYEKTIAQLQDQFKQVNTQVAAANEARDAAVKDRNDAIEKADADAEAARRQLVIDNQQQKAEIAHLTKDLENAKNLIVGNRHDRDTGAGEADGTILRINAADGEVIISLARKDRIVPGMTFSVYDPRLGVRFGTDDAAEGNGSIEVTEVGETSSICRITHVTKDHAIQAGNLISNVVYHSDKTRKFRFVVTGDFDLDGDGIYTAAERDRLINLITSWGGQVDDSVTSQTDYVVVGKEPAAPTVVEDAAATPAPGSVASERAHQQSQYRDIIDAAKGLSIPVLNANRFLAMVGYYNTTIVRY